MKNQDIAAQFEEIADALELKGEMQFKVLAYRRAARSLEELTEDIAELAKSGKLREIPGIGEGTAKKIVEYLDTGKMKKHAEALEGLSEELLDLLKGECGDTSRILSISGCYLVVLHVLLCLR